MFPPHDAVEPLEIFQNMSIKTVRAIQDADTRTISDFEVSFKMIRYASSQTVSTPVVIASGRTGTAGAPLNDLGTSSPSPSIGNSDATANMTRIG